MSRSRTSGEPWCAARRIDQTIRQQSTGAEIRTSLRVTGPLSVVDPELADHVEAVVREAVSNAVQHADASINVTHRAETAGGEFSVLPGPSDETGKHRGTRLRWSAPLP